MESQLGKQRIPIGPSGDPGVAWIGSQRLASAERK
jgi:hypothetical protein